MTLRDAQQELISALQKLYEPREAAVLADWVMENISGWKKIDRLLRKNEPLTAPALDLLKKYTAELLTQKPVQYVLHESWFAGMKFYVDEHVLIPRPETEELVEWIAAGAGPAPSILDVGTGSGCIAVTLKKKVEGSTVYACDISADALSIAQRNAATHVTSIHPASTHPIPIHSTPIQFLQLDFLDSRQRAALPPVHLLVSNPPYIPLKDKSTIARNVVGFEPHLALFVEDHDPLIFYRALADFAREKLLPGGGIFVEIHEELAAGVMTVFREAGFPSITLKKDMQGKERMIKATR